MDSGHGGDGCEWGMVRAGLGIGGWWQGGRDLDG